MCSMISSQCDELRERATALRQGRWADGEDDATLMEQAADTILELRDDLQRANEATEDAEHDESMAWDRVRKVEAENTKLRYKVHVLENGNKWLQILDNSLKANNAKLRELVRKYGEYTSQDHCEGCFCKSRCNDGDVDECWQLTEIRRLARELGVGEDT